MHSNSPSHVSKFINEFFAHKRFTGEKLKKWPSPCPDLNPIKNLWSFVKMKLYKGSKQYNSKADQWKAIKTAIMEIEPAEVKKSTKSMDDRLPAVTEKTSH